MTPEDGDMEPGFTAPIRPNPRITSDPSTAPWIACSPVKWDGDVEEIVVDVETDDDIIVQDGLDEVERDLDKLAMAADDMCVDTAKNIREAVDKIKSFDIKAGLTGLEHLAVQVESFRTTIDEIVPNDGG